ncbi:MAG: D-xylose transport system substrate-binding protein [Actinoplanes sp.]|nr:D-xylose transport system substrate-binding protein [Actinoplanes sp.]
MRTKMFALSVVGLLATVSLVACTKGGGGDSGGKASTGGGTKVTGTGTATIGVILPDTKSSQRWGTDDPKFFKAAFAAANVPADIRNAQGDKAQFAAFADSMIANGVKVLMIVNLDSASGKAVLDKAKAAGIPTIDYDRLTLNGGANYYVSFDNNEVGRLQGRGLKACLAAKGAKDPLVADLNGSPTDNNASQFKEGYEEILQPLYDDALYRKGPDQSVDDWNDAEAGIIFDQMMTQYSNKINGVVAANDGLANAAIAVLKKYRLNGKVPVTGQDATVQGLQNILAGDQCMTVYKPIKDEVKEAATLAIQLFKGQKVDLGSGQQIKDPESGAYLPAKLLTPRLITKANVIDVIRDGFADRKDVCAGDYAKYCTAAGI